MGVPSLERTVFMVLPPTVNGCACSPYRRMSRPQTDRSGAEIVEVFWPRGSRRAARSRPVRGLGQPSGEVAALGVGGRQPQRFAVGASRLAGAAHAAEQIGARGGQQVVP